MLEHLRDTLAERCQLEADALSGDPPSLFQSLIDLCVAFTRPDAFQSSFSDASTLHSYNSADESSNYIPATLEHTRNDTPVVPHIALFLASLVLSLWLCLLWRSRQSLIVKQPIRLEMDSEEEVDSDDDDDDGDDVHLCLAVAHLQQPAVDKRLLNQGCINKTQLPAGQSGGELQSAHPGARDEAYLVDLKLPV